MGRPKKDGKAINLIVKKEVADLLEEYCKATGANKTSAIELAIYKMVTEYKQVNKI